MRPIRFVHAADLHLDSPFRGMAEAPGAVAARLRQATFQTFQNIVDLCIAERADALLVAGDIYDESEIRLQAQLQFVKGLRQLDQAGIRSFVCHGNHDPLSGWSAGLDLPPSCHRFGPEIEAVPVDPLDPSWAMIHGVSYPEKEVRQNLAARFRAGAGARLNIALLHANLGTSTGHENYAPCTLDDLLRAGMDYWALGHVHRRQVVREAAPAVVYPGNPQGRHVNESGARGAYLVELAPGGPPVITFREAGVVRWEEVRVSIDGMERDQELLDALEGAVLDAREAAGGRDIVCRLVIEGRGPVHRMVARPGSLDALREHVNSWGAGSPFLYCGRIEERTGMAIDRAERARGEDLVADVIRVAEAAARDEDLLGALAEPLKELYDQPDLKRYLGGLPGPGSLRELLAGAETRALDELLVDAG